MVVGEPVQELLHSSTGEFAAQVALHSDSHERKPGPLALFHPAQTIAGRTDSLSFELAHAPLVAPCVKRTYVLDEANTVPFVCVPLSEVLLPAILGTCRVESESQLRPQGHSEYQVEIYEWERVPVFGIGKADGPVRILWPDADGRHNRTRISE